MTEGHRACAQESWCFFKSLVVSTCPCGSPCCWRTTAMAEGGKWSVERIPEWNRLNRRGQHWRPQKRLARPPSGDSVAFPRWHPCSGLCESLLLRIPACENEDDHENGQCPSRCFSRPIPGMRTSGSPILQMWKFQLTLGWVFHRADGSSVS